MSEFSETIYIRSDDRSAGVQLLQDQDLVGYVYEPRGGWVQVLPDWRNDQKMAVLKESSGLVIYYCYAEDQFWSFLVYRDGKSLFSYECIWEIDEFLCDGMDIEELAKVLRISPSKLEPLLYTGGGDASWDKLAEDAAVLADLLGFPNYAFASFDYADAELGGSGHLSEYYFDPNAEPPSPSEQSAEQTSVQPTAPDQEDEDDAPWQAVYNLASQFLKHLHDEELIELTLDTRLARDRLIERLTQTFIENPVSSDSQLLHHWLENLMTAPEIVDVFATDDMIIDAYKRAKENIQASSTKL